MSRGGSEPTCINCSSIKIDGQRIEFDESPRASKAFENLEPYISVIEHYISGQELGLLDKPLWFQQLILTFNNQIEQNKRDKFERERQRHTRDK